MNQMVWIPHVLPGLNEIIEAKRRVFKIAGRKGNQTDAYQTLKKKWGRDIGLIALSNSFVPILSGVFNYEFREPNRKRDPSNIIAGGVKLIEDALQTAGLLQGDGWKNVREIRTSWVVATQPGVLVQVSDCELWKK